MTKKPWFWCWCFFPTRRENKRKLKIERMMQYKWRDHSYWWPWSNTLVMKTEQRTNLKCQLFSSSFGKNFLKIKSKRHYSKNDDWNSTDSLSAKILMYVVFKIQQALRPAFTVRSGGSFRCLFLLSLFCDKYAKVDFMI